MGLESLLKPIKWVDEQIVKWVDEPILRQYTKAAKKWEEKNWNKYSLTTALSLSGYIAMLLHPSDPEVKRQIEETGIMNHLPAFTMAVGYMGLLFHDVWHSLDNRFNKKTEQTSGAIAEDKFNYLTKKIHQRARLPVLGYGLYCFYTLGASLVESGINISNENSAAFVVGLAFSTLASSMYIKDSDPKLLDKQSSWKKAYNRIKEKIDSLTLQPVPVKSYSTYT